tara:strand:+ start:93 stop:479 length:387 start_codon:yes stop_codon:yes gene_type:complete
MNVIYYDIPEIVNIRKYNVNVIELQKCLLKALKNSNKTKKQVAKELNEEFTTIEHYFRHEGSEYFSIPEPTIWIKLKEILNIKTNKFDISILTFEKKLSEFDLTNRVYDVNGIAPTITSTNADIRILY